MLNLLYFVRFYLPDWNSRSGGAQLVPARTERECSGGENSTDSLHEQYTLLDILQIYSLKYKLDITVLYFMRV